MPRSCSGGYQAKQQPLEGVTIWRMEQRPVLFDVPQPVVIDGVRDSCVAYRGLTLRWACGPESGKPHTASWRAGGAELYCWSQPSLRVELALLRFDPELPDGMQIDRGWLGVFRLQASRRVALPRLSCTLAGDVRGFTGGGDSGELLDAQTWDDGQTSVSIGTEDADALCRRARHARRLPPSWVEHLCPFFEKPESARHLRYPVVYLQHGVAIDLPPLPAGDRCEVHLAAALRPKTTDDDASTWYAVDIDPRRAGPLWVREH